MKKKFVSTLLVLSVMSTCLLSACGSKPASESVDLTSVSLDTIEEKAKEEGTISSVGMPDDWANWKSSWESISNTYGLAHDDTDMSSAEELSMFDSEKDSPTKDIGDVGQAFGPTAIDMDVVQPYKASTWDSIPDWAKDPDGNWTISYLGTMGALVNTNNVSETIDSWEALMNSNAKITLGDVLRGASSQMAVLSCAYAMGGDAENLDPAFDYFKELASEGRIDVGDGSVERLNRGEIDVLATWDYLTLQYRDIVAENNPDLNMECHIMQDGAVQSHVVGGLLDKFLPPCSFDIVFKLHTQGTIVPGVGKAAVDFAARIDKAAAFAQGHNLVHGFLRIEHNFTSHFLSITDRLLHRVW